MTAEEGWIGHILASGSCMPNYEYMDIPGMDYYGNFYISGASQTVNNGNLATLGFPSLQEILPLRKLSVL